MNKKYTFPCSFPALWPSSYVTVLICPQRFQTQLYGPKFHNSKFVFSDKCLNIFKLLFMVRAFVFRFSCAEWSVEFSVILCCQKLYQLTSNVKKHFFRTYTCCRGTKSTNPHIFHNAMDVSFLLFFFPSFLKGWGICLMLQMLI